MSEIYLNKFLPIPAPELTAINTWECCNYSQYFLSWQQIDLNSIYVKNTQNIMSSQGKKSFGKLRMGLGNENYVGSPRIAYKLLTSDFKVVPSK